MKIKTIALADAIFSDLHPPCPACKSKGTVLRSTFRHSVKQTERMCYLCVGTGKLFLPAEELTLIVEALREHILNVR